jgi:hypothetical protein
MKNKKTNIKKEHNQENKIEQATIIFFCISLVFLTIITIEKETTKEINQLTGNTLSKVNVSLPPNVPCEIEFKEGLNLVSFFCIVFETPRQNVTDNIQNLEYIFEYQESNSADRWKSYNPNLPSNVIQDLQTMSRTEGYWVRVSDDEYFNLSGGLRTPTNIYLVSGWNLAGYPTNRTKDVNESFLSISGNYTEVRSFNANTQSFISHVPPSSGGLTQTMSGLGYWINSSTTKTWVVEQ